MNRLGKFTIQVNKKNKKKSDCVPGDITGTSNIAYVMVTVKISGLDNLGFCSNSAVNLTVVLDK